MLVFGGCGPTFDQLPFLLVYDFVQALCRDTFRGMEPEAESCFSSVVKEEKTDRLRAAFEGALSRD